jgi:hypothetical protein
MSIRSGPLIVLFFAGLTLGCSGALGRVEESRDFSIPGERFHRIAIIAGGSTSFDLQVAVRTQQTLEEEGYEASTPSGRWGSPSAAVEDLCAAEDAGQDGVIIVVWDDLELRDCETRRVAFHIKGGFGGVEEMTERLLRYLRGQPPK